MPIPASQDLAERAEALYAERLRQLLEPEHNGEFLVIEPDSGDYFLGRTLMEASRAAREKHPGRLTHVMRVGHKTAFHFGLNVQ